MARKQFLIKYPDRSFEHIGTAKRDQMAARGELRLIAENCYEFTGEQKTLHSLAELSTILPRIQKQEFRRFLPGSFIWQHKDTKLRERMETPEGMAIRLAGSPA